MGEVPMYKPSIIPLPKLDDLFHIIRYMCRRCGLILDYQYGNHGLPGWPDFDPPLDRHDVWIDKDGDCHVEEIESKELCPRCGAFLNDYQPLSITIRETKTISDFYQKGEGEGQTLELKEQFSAEKIKKTIAAFATCQGGKIILGVTDDGVLKGYKGDENIETTEGKDKLQQRILGLLDSIKPRVQVRIHFVDNEAGLQFAVIVVPKGTSPIYFVNGKCYIRELAQTRGAEPEEVIQLVKSFLERRDESSGKL